MGATRPRLRWGRTRSLRQATWQLAAAPCFLPAEVVWRIVEWRRRDVVEGRVAVWTAESVADGMNRAFHLPIAIGALPRVAISFSHVQKLLTFFSLVWTARTVGHPLIKGGVCPVRVSADSSGHSSGHFVRIVNVTGSAFPSERSGRSLGRRKTPSICLSYG